MIINIEVFVVGRFGVVRFESVMKLREQLELLGKMSGITRDEKGESLDYYVEQYVTQFAKTSIVTRLKKKIVIIVERAEL